MSLNKSVTILNVMHLTQIGISYTLQRITQIYLPTVMSLPHWQEQRPLNEFLRIKKM